MVDIEPFKFERCTAFKERTDLAIKLNEIIEKINDGDIIPDSFKERINQIERDIADINVSIADIDTEISELNDSVDTSIETVNQRIDDEVEILNTSLSDKADKTQIGENVGDGKHTLQVIDGVITESKRVMTSGSGNQYIIERYRDNGNEAWTFLGLTMKEPSNSTTQSKRIPNTIEHAFIGSLSPNISRPNHIVTNTGTDTKYKGKWVELDYYNGNTTSGGDIYYCALCECGYIIRTGNGNTTDCAFTIKLMRTVKSSDMDYLLATTFIKVTPFKGTPKIVRYSTHTFMFVPDNAYDIICLYGGSFSTTPNKYIQDDTNGIRSSFGIKTTAYENVVYGTHDIPNITNYSNYDWFDGDNNLIEPKTT